MILGYTAIVDPPAFGWHAEAFVALYCEGDMPGEAIKRAVERDPGVVVGVHGRRRGERAPARPARGHQATWSRRSSASATPRGVTRTVTEVVLSTLFTR